SGAPASPAPATTAVSPSGTTSSTWPLAPAGPHATVSVSRAASPPDSAAASCSPASPCSPAAPASVTLVGEKCTATGTFPAGAAPFPCSQYLGRSGGGGTRS